MWFLFLDHICHGWQETDSENKSNNERGRGRETKREEKGEREFVSSSAHWESHSLLCRAKDLGSAVCDVSFLVFSATPVKRSSAFLLF